MQEITVYKARILGRYALAVVSNAHPARNLKDGETVSLHIGDAPAQTATVITSARPRPTGKPDFGDLRWEIDRCGDPFMLVGFEIMSRQMFEILELLLAQFDDINVAVEANQPDYEIEGGDFACYMLFRIA